VDRLVLGFHGVRHGFYIGILILAKIVGDELAENAGRGRVHEGLCRFGGARQHPLGATVLLALLHVINVPD
jgi:hypothetical protein